ncbi:MAG: NADH-quinone oxidoreductase subunit NuoF [Candidatus Krumholzibacteria bacterium]|nr:NADH-quinone oxidoreductase subunit NuoF [Candidatus Krumholzibacteria bacterium]MDH4337912.1 NADH-quinone oxidoreductase subunit NuoF [Candidatus Krumholzibacteria bacterium]
MSHTIISTRFDKKDNHTLAGYLANGGYRTLPKLFGMKPDEVIEEVKRSGLRGRGGAGFPTGMKWSFVPKNTDKPKYLCVNADEGEPGTFKDQLILKFDPHALIEGIIVCCYAVGIKTAYVYIRGEYDFPIARFSAAVAEAYAKGYLGRNIQGSGFDLDVVVHRGAGAYICGEETGLIESLEGKKGQPRPKPPFPAVVGAFGCPTVVNNVETIAALPWIMENGAAAYAAIGTEKSKGTMLFSISGMVERPGVYESEFGVNLWDFIEKSTGGIKGGRKLKAVIPGGSSSAILTAEEARNVNLDYESIAAAGSMVGSGAIMVLDEDTCVVRALEVVLRFYAHESCGQCPPCREGTYWMYQLVSRIRAGRGRPEDIDTLLAICPDMTGRTVCVLADSAAIPTASYIKKFRPEFEAYIDKANPPERKLMPGGVNLEAGAH